MKNIKQEIKNLKYAIGLAYNVNCTQEETEEFKKIPTENLPEDIIFSTVDDTYRRYQEINTTLEEKQEFYILKQLSYLKSIRKCLVFFVSLTVISLIVYAILLITGGSMALSGIFY